MKIVVPIKQVSELDSEFELDDEGTDVDLDFVERDLNEWDAYSLEAALQIREAVGNADVLVVTVGDDEADEALLTCLAKGADRAVRVASDTVDTNDPLAVALALFEDAIKTSGETERIALRESTELLEEATLLTAAATS